MFYGTAGPIPCSALCRYGRRDAPSAPKSRLIILTSRPSMGAGWGGGDVGTSNARRLRQNRTDAERALWARLRRKQLDGARFRQQVPLGPYVVDFLCFERRLIVEVDGGQHSLAMPADQARTAWLEERGFRLIRFWNHDVL